MRWIVGAGVVAGSALWAGACSSPVQIDRGGAGDDASQADDAALSDGTSDGAGLITCSDGQTVCSGACVDPASDTENCGNCSNRCSSGEMCLAGQCCAPPPGAGVCNVYLGCGCSTAENCARVDGGPEECVPNGNVTQLGVVTDSTNCAHGLVDSEGVCVPACLTQANCLSNYVCLAQQRDTADAGVPLGYSACAPHCNPVSPLSTDSTHVACGAGERCEPFGNTQGETTCERSTGTFGQAVACPSMSDFSCAAGYACVNYGDLGTYYSEKYCRTTTDCLAGSCAALSHGGQPVLDLSTPLGACQ
jgi:Stigma-specific protein, Stig1